MMLLTSSPCSTRMRPRRRDSRPVEAVRYQLHDRAKSVGLGLSCHLEVVEGFLCFPQPRLQGGLIVPVCRRLSRLMFMMLTTPEPF